jgi:hypothetical protein
MRVSPAARRSEKRTTAAQASHSAQPQVATREVRSSLVDLGDVTSGAALLAAGPPRASGDLAMQITSGRWTGALAPDSIAGDRHDLRPEAEARSERRHPLRDGVIIQTGWLEVRRDDSR